MKVEYKEIVAYTEQDEKINKWRYIIQRNNTYNTETLFISDYIFNTEHEATQAIQKDGKFDEFNKKLY